MRWHQLNSNYFSYVHLVRLEAAQFEILEVAQSARLDIGRPNSESEIQKPQSELEGLDTLSRPSPGPRSPRFQPINNVSVPRGYYLQVATMQQLASQRFMCTRNSRSLAPT